MPPTRASREAFFTNRTDRELLNQLDDASVPRHVAIIMDGNGRWAAKRGVPRIFGHRAGAKAIRESIAASIELGIEYLTIYSFSSENWRRSAEEVDGLMGLFVEVLDNGLDNLMRQSVRVRVIGSEQGMPEATMRAFRRTENATAGNSALTLLVALNDTARTEIADAVREIAKETADGSLSPESIDEQTISAHLYTRDVPDPDLIIRTSGEMRVSNFLLWQLAYSEIWVTAVLWPDFKRGDLLRAVVDYQKRSRRFGGLFRSLPDEGVDRVGDQVEPVRREAVGDSRLDALQLAGDPAVGAREAQRRRRRVVCESAVVLLAVHQHEAGRVPQLVAEVAVALAALAVEVDAASQRGHRGEGEAQRVGAVAGDAAGEFGLGRGAYLGRQLGLAQPGAALFQQRCERDAVDQVDRIEHVAFALAHLVAVRVEHQAVDVDVAKRHLAGEVGRHHDHPSDPEEDDVVAGDEHRRRQEQVLLDRLARPAERRERHQRRRVPGVEHVLIALQRAAVTRRLRPRARLVLVARDDDAAVGAVPGRNLVAPPQLAADAPVLDVVHPLVVGVDPLLGNEAHLPRCDRVDRPLRDRLAVGARPGGRDEPLVGEHRLDDLAGARAARHHHAVLLRLDQQPLRVELGDDALACVEPVEAAVVYVSNLSVTNNRGQ